MARIDLARAALVGARAFAGATTATTTSTWTSIALNSERFDSSAFHDNVTNNSRHTVPAGLGGYYLIGGNAEFAHNATGQRGCRILLNGATRLGEILEDATAATPGNRIIVTTLYALVPTDYVELQVWQNSGGALSTANTANSTCEFWIQRVAI